jgi:hypothetical protein
MRTECDYSPILLSVSRESDENDIRSLLEQWVPKYSTSLEIYSGQWLLNRGEIQLLHKISTHLASQSQVNLGEVLQPQMLEKAPSPLPKQPMFRLRPAVITHQT